MKKVILFLSLLLCLMTLSAKSKDHDKLRKELTQWQQFSAEGVIEVNYQMFSLRKLFVISSAAQQIRLDIYLIQRGDQPRLRIKGAAICGLVQHLDDRDLARHTAIDQPLLCLEPGRKVGLTPEWTGLKGLLRIDHQQRCLHVCSPFIKR